MLNLVQALLEWLLPIFLPSAQIQTQTSGMMPLRSPADNKQADFPAAQDATATDVVGSGYHGIFTSGNPVPHIMMVAFGVVVICIIISNLTVKIMERGRLQGFRESLQAVGMPIKGAKYIDDGNPKKELSQDTHVCPNYQWKRVLDKHESALSELQMSSMDLDMKLLLLHQRITQHERSVRVQPRVPCHRKRADVSAELPQLTAADSQGPASSSSEEDAAQPGRRTKLQRTDTTISCPSCTTRNAGGAGDDGVVVHKTQREDTPLIGLNMAQGDARITEERHHIMQKGAENPGETRMPPSPPARSRNQLMKSAVEKWRRASTPPPTVSLQVPPQAVPQVPPQVVPQAVPQVPPQVPPQVVPQVLPQVPPPVPPLPLSMQNADMLQFTDVDLVGRFMSRHLDQPKTQLDDPEASDANSGPAGDGGDVMPTPLPDDLPDVPTLAHFDAGMGPHLRLNTSS